MSTPIMISKSEGQQVCLQRQIRIQLHFFKNGVRIGCRIVDTWLFCSFHIIQTQANQITLKNECDDLSIPTIGQNWWKWSRTPLEETEEIWSHRQTRGHTPPNVSQPKNRWSTTCHEHKPAKQCYVIIQNIPSHPPPPTLPRCTSCCTSFCWYWLLTDC